MRNRESSKVWDTACYCKSHFYNNRVPSILVPGAFDLIRFTARQGPLAFYKGYVPAFVRLAPQTVLTFIFLEQLKKNFGRVKEASEN